MFADLDLAGRAAWNMDQKMVGAFGRVKAKAIFQHSGCFVAHRAFQTCREAARANCHKPGFWEKPGLFTSSQ